MRAAAMYRTSVRDWHLGQRGRAAVRGDRVCACESGMHAPSTIRLSLPNSLSSMDANGRAAITELCRLGSGARWSILLIFENLTGGRLSQTIDGDDGRVRL